MKDAAGAAFTITPPSALRPMGTEPFFPLCSRRETGTTPTQTAAQIPSSGLGPCAWSDITLAPSQAFGKSLPGFSYGNSRVALFVALLFCNTVVLGSGGLPRKKFLN